MTHPTQGPPPAEFIHFVKKGLQKDPSDRYQSINEMIDLFEAALDGRVRVQCPFTAQKRMTQELARFADRHPFFAMATFLSAAVGSVGALVWALILTLHGR